VKTLSLDVNDLRGNTVTRINVDTATTDSWVSFDEYGNREGASTGKLVTYDAYGQYERATTSQGLILMGARVYNPVTNQFTSADPVTGGNETSYTYPNDPINKTDFDGAYSEIHETLSTGLDIAVTALGWMACKGAFAICVGVSTFFGAVSGALKGIREANERGLKGWDYFSHLAGSVAIDAGSAAIGAVVGRGAEKLMSRIFKGIKTTKKILRRFRTAADVSAGHFAGSYLSSRASSVRDYLLYDRKNR
jgi:RHS repeat-associated protein